MESHCVCSATINLLHSVLTTGSYYYNYRETELPSISYYNLWSTINRQMKGTTDRAAHKQVDIQTDQQVKTDSMAKRKREISPFYE